MARTRRYQWWAGCAALISCSTSHPVLEAGYDIVGRREQAAVNPCYRDPVVAPPVLKGSRLDVAWGTADLKLVLHDRLDDRLMPNRVVVILDDTTVLQAAGADKRGVYELLRGTVEPGRHELGFIVRAQGKGRHEGYRFERRLTHSFDATDDRPTVLHIVVWEEPMRQGRATYAPGVCIIEEHVAPAVR